MRLHLPERRVYKVATPFSPELKTLQKRIFEGEKIRWALKSGVSKDPSIFPEIFVNAVEALEPNQLAEFVNDLATKFNSFYAKLRVLQAENQKLRDARLGLVEAFRITVRNTLNLLGIEVLERM